MSFREEAKAYLVGPFFKRVPEDSTFDGNGILYTGIYFDLLASRRELMPEDKAQLLSLYTQSLVAPGLINRGHDNLSMEKHDDYIGLCRAAQILSPAIAYHIYLYGHEHFYLYKNTAAKGIFDYLGCWYPRLPGVVQHIKICADVELNLWDQLWFFIGMASNYFSKPENASGAQLTYLMYKAYKDYGQKYWLCDLGIKLFLKGLKKKYTMGISDVFQMFFQEDYKLEQKKTHIFAKYAPIHES